MFGFVIYCIVNKFQRNVCVSMRHSCSNMEIEKKMNSTHWSTSDKLKRKTYHVTRVTCYHVTRNMLSSNCYTCQVTCYRVTYCLLIMLA